MQPGLFIEIRATRYLALCLAKDLTISPDPLTKPIKNTQDVEIRPLMYKTVTQSLHYKKTLKCVRVMLAEVNSLEE